MRNFMEKIIIAGFVLFIVGGFLLVLIQLVGLVLGNSYLMVHANGWFSWIYPCAAITGALCYLLSYGKKKN
ncbi:hypothetical protein [Enterococcus pallens]|uniref:Integral membrane protein n=1 Tax=Enterococcus pallens ATCC BAA-351 TaxID=1158607 RepID=R2T0D9_9ENTE|nr:hypothetical protein [Enterococcus pallens]EOH93744.1 hypothetical protein UAU_02440 [Enterococcus pallens ATCC BAA-351]EOU24584.1 hypothetical protein I588_00571 [Enterococcus pallens ATCC BAA-351]OJG79593.1 hypothetical protein RV10_GL000720 [Enterococcus pallens]